MTTTTLKLIALVLMTIDHVGEFIPEMPLFLRYIGRLSAVIFFFCCVEGYTHTRNKKRYVLRLYVCGQIMTALDLLLPMAVHHSTNLSWTNYIQNNVFLEIFGMTALLYFWEHSKGKKRIIGTIVFWLYQIIMPEVLSSILRFEQSDKLILAKSLVGLFFERGYFVDCTIILFYLTRNNKKKMAIAYTCWIGLYIFDNVLCVPALLNPLIQPIGIEFFKRGTIWERAFQTDFQWMMIFSLPLLLMYNGKRGKGLKWLFYVYYPVHIAVLYLLGQMLTA